MVSGYRAFLSIPGARRLLISAVVTRVPNGMLSLAILLLIRGRTGSFAVAGVAVGAFALANAAVAPIQGALVDRLGQPRVLGVCAVGQSALLVLLVAAAQAGLPAIAPPAESKRTTASSTEQKLLVPVEFKVTGTAVAK